MSRESADYLLDMLEACNRIVSYTQGTDRGALFSDTKTVDALIRNLTVLGEAAKRVPETIRAQAPEVPGVRLPGCATCWSTTISVSTRASLWTPFSSTFPACGLRLSELPLSSG